MSDIPPPPKFRPGETDKETTWKSWKQSFTIYLVAKGLDTSSGKRKVNLLLHFLGPDGQKLFNTFVFAPANGDIAAESAENLDTVIRKYDEHYGRGKSRMTHRQSFLSRGQEPGESIIDYIADLKHLASLCEYGDLEQSLLVDRILNGVSNQHCKTRLYDMTDEELTLENCIRIARTSELTDKKLEAERVHFTNVEGRNTCPFCDSTHRRGECPAYYRYCNACGVQGHYAKSQKCRDREPRNYSSQRGHTSGVSYRDGRNQQPSHRDRQQPSYSGRQQLSYRERQQQSSNRDRQQSSYRERQQSYGDTYRDTYRDNSMQRRGRGSSSHRGRSDQKLNSVYQAVHNDSNIDPYAENENVDSYVDHVDSYVDNVDNGNVDSHNTDGMNEMFETQCNVYMCDYDDDANWSVDMICQGKHLKLHIDTGARCNILNETTARMFRGTIRDSSVLINGIHNKPVKCVGIITLPLFNYCDSK